MHLNTPTARAIHTDYIQNRIHAIRVFMDSSFSKNMRVKFIYKFSKEWMSERFWINVMQIKFIHVVLCYDMAMGHFSEMENL